MRLFIAASLSAFLAFSAYSFEPKEWEGKGAEVIEFVNKNLWKNSKPQDMSTEIILCTHEYKNKNYCCVYRVKDKATGKTGVVKYSYVDAHNDLKPDNYYDKLKEIHIDRVRLFFPKLIKTEGKMCFIYMDQAEGKDLVYLDGDSEVFIKACKAWGQALRKLHDAGIIHNDMHSSNLMFRFDENGEALIDFVDLDDFEFIEDQKARREKELSDLKTATDDIMCAMSYIKGQGAAQDAENKAYKENFEFNQKRLFGQALFYADKHSKKYVDDLKYKDAQIFVALSEDPYLGFKMYEAFVDGYLGSSTKKAKPRPLVSSKKKKPVFDAPETPKESFFEGILNWIKGLF